MNPLRKAVRRLPQMLAGILVALAGLGGLLLAGTLLGAASARPADYAASRYHQDFALADLVKGSKTVADWDCGCGPKNSRPEILKWKKGERAWTRSETFDPEAYPARCLYENHSSELAAEAQKAVKEFKGKEAAGNRETLKAKAEIWRPYNNRGERWPRQYYPHGFPDDAESPKPASFPLIPFPGWPLERKYDPLVKWDDKPRDEYRRWYQANGIRPADAKKLQEAGLPANPPLDSGGSVARTRSRASYRPGWTHYQIHHIFERRFGGQNHWANLAPVYSRRGTNLHQNYTTWWTHTKVDGDILKLRTRATQDLRDRLRACQN